MAGREMAEAQRERVGWGVMEAHLHLAIELLVCGSELEGLLCCSLRRHAVGLFAVQLLLVLGHVALVELALQVHPGLLGEGQNMREEHQNSAAEKKVG